MQATTRTFVFFIGFFFLAGAAHSAEVDERKKVEEEIKGYRFKTVTTPEGLNFTIPEDMPIETRNGLKGPIPFDEYLYFKFRKLDEKLTETNVKIDKLLDSTEAIQKKLAEIQKMAEKHEAAPEKSIEPASP